MQIFKNKSHVVQGSFVIVYFTALESGLFPDWLDLETTLFLAEDPTPELTQTQALSPGPGVQPGATQFLILDHKQMPRRASEALQERRVRSHVHVTVDFLVVCKGPCSRAAAMMGRIPCVSCPAQ